MSSGLRSATAGQTAGAPVRSGRASLGAHGSFSSRNSVTQGSAATTGSTSVLSALAAAGGTTATAAALSTSARQSGAAPAAVTVTTPKGDAVHTPVPPAGSARFNPVYNDDSIRSNTPSVNTKAYAPKLSPQFAELERQGLQQPEQPAAASDATAAPWPAAADGVELGSAGTSTSIRSGRFVPAKAPVAGSTLVPEKPPKPQNYLRTTGDLFNLSDQDSQVVLDSPAMPTTRAAGL